MCPFYYADGWWKGGEKSIHHIEQPEEWFGFWGYKDLIRQIWLTWHLDHVPMRGKENVLGEVSILFTVYNLRRSLLFLNFLDIFNTSRSIFRLFSK